MEARHAHLGKAEATRTATPPPSEWPWIVMRSSEARSLSTRCRTAATPSRTRWPEVCGQPLDWTDVRPFVLKFEELDVSHTGTISLDDLSKFAEQQRRRRVRQRLEQAKAHITLVKEVAALKRMSFSSAARTTSRRKRNRLQAWRLNEGWAKKQPTRPRPDSGPRALAGRPEAAEGSWA